MILLPVVQSPPFFPWHCLLILKVVKTIRSLAGGYGKKYAYFECHRWFARTCIGGHFPPLFPYCSCAALVITTWMAVVQILVAWLTRGYLLIVKK